MTQLAAAAITFFLLHRIVSGSRLRDTLAGVIGETAFRRVFALASLGCVVCLWIGYLQARDGGHNVWIFTPFAAFKPAQWIVQFAAIQFIVAGLSTRNPTIAGMGAAVRKPDIVRGALRITRHPFLWGISLFSAGHMLAAPNAASWGFFGTLLVLALTGTFSIDAKRRRAFGEDWKAFEALTSNIPFAAMVSGRQPWDLKEIGVVRFTIASAVFLVLLVFHPFLFGASV